MKKKIFFITSTLLALSILTFMFIYNMDNKENNMMENINSNSINIANNSFLTMMLETESGSGVYKTSASSTWPGEGYVFNEDLSVCENGGKLQWDENNNIVKLISNGSDKCYVYFDVFTETPRTSAEMLQYLGLSLASGTPNFANTSCTNGSNYNSSGTAINNGNCQEQTVGVYAAEDDLGTSYYFRGDVENNYVYFAGFYWRIIRINGDGTLRLIYDGTMAHENGEASDDRYIAKTAFNNITRDNTFVGYMNGIEDGWIDGGAQGNVDLQGFNSSNNYCYSSSYTFNSATGSYTLSGNVTCTPWSSSFVNKYMCFSKNATSCRHLYYITSYNSSTWASSIEYTGLGIGNTTYSTTHSNINDSIIKDVLDNWFEINIYDTPYYNFVSDAIYCNDRSLYSGSGNSKDETTYSGYNRLNNRAPTLKCNQENDRFSVENNINNISTNGKLLYPVGLITSDEVIYAGSSGTNCGYYLNIGTYFWTMTPAQFTSTQNGAVLLASQYMLDGWDGGIISYTGGGARPVISLKSSITITGDGTINNPFVVS